MLFINICRRFVGRVPIDTLQIIIIIIYNNNNNNNNDGKFGV